jgi:DNA polymerase/3'-5' exonuclease PolX
MVRRIEPTNEEIAEVLERTADLLESQDANAFRVRAYRMAAQSVRDSQRSVAKLAAAGVQDLQQLPGVGERLARTIAEFVATGRSNLLDRLQGEVSPEDLFTKVPGIGEELARRIAAELDIDTLEELEIATYDGQLQKLKGFGPRRIQAVRHGLAGLLSQSERRRVQKVASGETPSDRHLPSIGLLLDIDAEYRRRAEAGDLRKITPRRFYPEQKAWLPVMHREGEGWHFTALYSNTARAHELGATRDWVVIYFSHDGDEGQCTVVTVRSGALGANG